jgi:hypothetical protein
MNIFSFNSVYKLRDVRPDEEDCLPQLRAGGTKAELKILQGCEGGGGSGEAVEGATRTATESYNRAGPCLKSSIAGS